VVVAEEIWIEGPDDLLGHVAIEQDLLRVDYTTKTTTDGLLQEATVREGVRAQIHARIDEWQVAALRRLVVLQRPGEVPVTIRATGDAFWACTDTGQEQRRAMLEWKGERPR
jgi:hypothetical protein